MKQNKMNIFTMVALGGLMICAPIARADDAPPAATPPAAGAGGHERGGPQKALDSLGLTPDQMTQAKAALKDQREKMMALRNDASVTADDKKAKGKTIMEATDAKLKTIFTADQYTKWEAARKTMRPHGKQGDAAPSTGPDVPTKAN